jgi:fructose-specific phosphotransferase system IIC component
MDQCVAGIPEMVVGSGRHGMMHLMAFGVALWCPHNKPWIARQKMDIYVG